MIKRKKKGDTKAKAQQTRGAATGHGCIAQTTNKNKQKRKKESLSLARTSLLFFSVLSTLNPGRLNTAAALLFKPSFCHARRQPHFPGREKSFSEDTRE
jgi:hypothetical protein